MTMMLPLTAKEVRSLGKALTFRAVREQGAGLYLIRGRSRDGEEREGERQKKRKEGEHEVGRGGGGRRGCMGEIAVMMCMREGDSERQGERV